MNQWQINELETHHNITSTICDMTPKHLDTFGKRVRILRHGVGMNQQDLVNALEAYGVSIGRSYVSELERTDKTPTGDVVAAFARALGTTTDYLLMLTDEDEPQAETIEAFSEEAEEVARIVDAMRPERRLDVLALVDALNQRDSTYSNRSRRFSALLNQIVEEQGEDGWRRIEALLRSFGSSSHSGGVSAA